MPSYVVDLDGGGQMTVNASSPQAAVDNVRASGNTPAADGGGGGGSSPPAGYNAQAVSYNNYGDAVFNTPNGQKTGTQIMQELQAAGWNGQGNPVDVYNRTAGGGGNSSSPSNPSSPSNNDYGGDYANYQNNSLLLQGANNAAQAAYNQGMLKFNNDKLAFDMATQAFNNAISAAGLTGTFQGNPTIPAMQSYANLFGTWGVPTQGQQTLGAQQQGFNQQQALAQMYGQYYAPGQTPTAGMTTQAAQQQAWNQQMDAQKQALAQWSAQQGAAQDYLKMMAGLRGPADWIQYQKVLGATPGGLQDLAAAAAGQYIPGGGATTGVQPQAVTLQSFVNSATGGQLGGQQQGAQQSGAPAGSMAPPIGSNADQTTAFQNSLVAPNQMAPQTWANLTPSQQQMLLGTWESQGYTQDDAKALFTQQLPKYASQTGGAGSFRLQ